MSTAFEVSKTPRFLSKRAVTLSEIVHTCSVLLLNESLTSTHQLFAPCRRISCLTTFEGISGNGRVEGNPGTSNVSSHFRVCPEVYLKEI
jgi:hypothetical protein